MKFPTAQEKNMSHSTRSILVTRTWNLELFGSYGEGGSARVSLGRKTVTLSGGRDAQGNLLPLTGTINGQKAPAAKVIEMLEWAKAEGHVDQVNDDRRPLTIGKKAARELHIEMGRLGYRGVEHYSLAGEALEREVTSLATLTAEEAQIAWSYARAQVGLAA